ncbi:MAG TPA: 4-hydroxy-3-methylbut-2-enyl diphosphate reductase [Bacteroidales bacterium]|nr:4-hydroxy-3-methylbut-2-enyl diphosphate reductase [Bacteroidales bacterium]HOE04768.1 4-hydroxy-3-methylbut-2-enyl diphosphate reductase [Bacteroidales bacterium]
MIVEIDPNSGFCPGVTHAIEKAEIILSEQKQLYCLGDIVHNSVEVERLTRMGLEIIDHAILSQLRNVTVLIRAHGEPPETYETARKNNIQLIDASCPVVLRLQKRIRDAAKAGPSNIQIVIFGKKNHAEVNGLVGQVPGQAIVVSDIPDLDQVDAAKPVFIFSQTTQSPEKFKLIVDRISEKAIQLTGSNSHIKSLNSICPLMSKREPLIAEFAARYSVILFVSDRKSSNGKMLFDICKSINPRSYFIARPDEIVPQWFRPDDTVGVCGATSTPLRLMKEVAESVEKM